MDDLALLLLSALVCVPAYLIARMIKKREIQQPKIDDGYCLSYARLSSRRKLIRTLWGGPFVLSLVTVVVWANPENFVLRILWYLMIPAYIIEVGYRWFRWSREIQCRTPDPSASSSY